IAELDPAAVLLQTEVPLLPGQPGVGAAIDGAGLVVVEVGVDDLLAVQLDRHLPALADDAVAVPLADRLRSTLLGGGDAVDRAWVLPLLEALGAGVVENLDLHSRKRGVALHRRPQRDAGVAPLGHLELQPQLEVAVLLLGHQPAAPAAVDEEDALVG